MQPSPLHYTCGENESVAAASVDSTTMRVFLYCTTSEKPPASVGEWVPPGFEHKKKGERTVKAGYFEGEYVMWPSKGRATAVPVTFVRDFHMHCGLTPKQRQALQGFGKLVPAAAVARVRESE